MSDSIQTMEDALKAVSPGTDLRSALDMILAADTGALICIGDAEEVLKLSSGGFVIDVPFTPNRLFELAKMDGAIILDAHARRILRANTHLTPTDDFETKETGMRHRTAMRMCVQTDTLAITVSQRRNVVSLFFGGESEMLTKSGSAFPQAKATLLAMQNARDVLDRDIARLSQLVVDEQEA